MKTPIGPPRWARAVLSALLPRRYRDNQMGDLEEEFYERMDRDDEQAAKTWYRKQVIASLWGAVRLRGRERSERESSGGWGMENWLQDLRYAVRSLAGNKMYSVIATLTLAMGIGVNTAIFSLVSQVLFLDLPFTDADEMAWVWSVNREIGSDIVPFPDFQARSASTGLNRWAR